ncbi:MAG TPA: type II toxin-antitoxin system PemK/MazF family toxin [Desulfobacterales bacterium]|nr:type II toxin-antitoxin system PemK/MazF family toxin [Desulfobacterales bacterium]
MMRHSVICNQWEVVVVPFPFSEKPAIKRRPAVVLTCEKFNRSGHTVLAMITTQFHREWPSDMVIEDYESAGLKLPCVVRLKLFTLDNRLILKTVGHLSTKDTAKVRASLNLYLP